MKKIYILLSAACVVASASAAKKEMAIRCPQSTVVEKPMVKASAPKVKDRVSDYRSFQVPGDKKVMSTRAEGDSVPSFQGLYFRPADNVMSVGMNEQGSGWLGVHFASSYGNIDFENFSLGVNDMKWSYAELNDYFVADSVLNWNYNESTAYNLSIKSGFGMADAPVLMGTVNGTADYYDAYTNRYYCGGAPSFWGFNTGVSFYQNPFLANSRGSNGALYYYYSYCVSGEEGYEASGIASDWYTYLAKRYPNNTVTDLSLENYTIILPKTPSAYLMKSGWIWMNVVANAPAQLISYIYPIDEEGYITENAIAVGYAGIPAEGTDCPVFEYFALNEDGDETEDDIIIDSEVAVTIEGFNGNPAIVEASPVCGFYPFSYNLYLEAWDNGVDIIKAPDLYITAIGSVDGSDPRTLLLANDLNLATFDGTDPNDPLLTSIGYSQFTIDAIFPWIVSANGEEEVTIPLTGGSVDVDVDALYYNINAEIEDGRYVENHSDWINLTIGESDYDTGLTTLSIAAEASDVDRVGVVEIKGLGLTYSLKVIQGKDDGTAVSTILLEKNAEYYDLAGRRVANPYKGIYIKKSGNKAEKVIL